MSVRVPGPGSTMIATLLYGREVRPCVVPCLAGGPSPDTPVPSFLALPWAEVTSRACSGGSNLKPELMMILALSLVAIMPVAMSESVRILFISQDRCWTVTVGSLLY